MSLQLAIAAAGIAQQAGLFGGGGGGGSNVNLARGFSARCGISPPITQAAARQAKKFPDPCAFARGFPTGMANVTLPPLPTANPLVVPPGGTGVGSFGPAVLGAITGSGTAQASPIGLAAAGVGAILTPSLRRKAIAFAKSFGIQLAATVFGISLLEMADLVAKPPRRRRRGITAAQLANARRVNCKIQTMAKSLGMTCSGRAAPRRKSTCR